MDKVLARARHVKLYVKKKKRPASTARTDSHHDGQNKPVPRPLFRLRLLVVDSWSIVLPPRPCLNLGPPPSMKPRGANIVLGRALQYGSNMLLENEICLFQRARLKRTCLGV